MASIESLKDLNQRAQLAVQRDNSTTARQLWESLLEQIPCPSSLEPSTSEPDVETHTLAIQACFQLQQNIDRDTDEVDDEALEEKARIEQIAFLRRALCHAACLFQPTSAQQDLEVGLIRATLASLLLPTPPEHDSNTSPKSPENEEPKVLFDQALKSIRSASVKRKSELLEALRPQPAGASTSSDQGSQGKKEDVAEALQTIYDAPSSHFIHLAADLAVEDLDQLGKSVMAFFEEQVPGSIGIMGKGETALNVGEVLCDKAEDLELDGADDDESQTTEDHKEKDNAEELDKLQALARTWLQQGMLLRSMALLGPF